MSRRSAFQTVPSASEGGSNYYGEYEECYLLIGDRITMLRARTHTTQKQLAERVGCSEGTIARAELGKLRLPVHQILKIAAALGVDAAEIFSAAKGAK